LMSELLKVLAFAARFVVSVFEGMHFMHFVPHAAQLGAVAVRRAAGVEPVVVLPAHSESEADSEAEPSSPSDAPDCIHWTFSTHGSNQFVSRARCRLCGLIWRGGAGEHPPWPL
jgi:hypothetical protein